MLLLKAAEAAEREGSVVGVSEKRAEGESEVGAVREKAAVRGCAAEVGESGPVHTEAGKGVFFLWLLFG